MKWSKHFDENFAVGDDQKNDLVENLKRGKDCTVSEASYMFECERKKIIKWLGKKVPDAEVQWIAFENDLETANWNCVMRDNKGDPAGHVCQNCRTTAYYSYPEGAEILPIYKLACKS